MIDPMNNNKSKEPSQEKLLQWLYSNLDDLIDFDDYDPSQERKEIFNEQSRNI